MFEYIESGLAQSLAVRSMTPRMFLQLIDAALAGGAGLDAEIVTPHLDALRAHVNEEATLTMVQLRPHLQAIHAHAAEVGAPYVVPEGHLFMMGDNRFNSADSRYWGPLDVDLIKGKAMFIYWSWDKERTMPRFSRLGDLIK